MIFCSSFFPPLVFFFVAISLWFSHNFFFSSRGKTSFYSFLSLLSPCYPRKWLFFPGLERWTCVLIFIPEKPPTESWGWLIFSPEVNCCSGKALALKLIINTQGIKTSSKWVIALINWVWCQIIWIYVSLKTSNEGEVKKVHLENGQAI